MTAQTFSTGVPPEAERAGKPHPALAPETPPPERLRGPKPWADEAKNFLRSKTIIGLLAAAVAWAFQQWLGVRIDEATGQAVVNELVNLICGGIQLGGLVYAAYGRFKAKGPITLGKAGKAALALAAFLYADPARAAELGPPQEAAQVLALSLAPALINLLYVLAGFLLAILFWLLVVDRLVLRGFDTQRCVAQGNLAVANFAGLSFLGLCVMIGMLAG